MAGVQSISLTTPTDYTAEQQSIERQRKMAELLQQQSMQPLDTNQTAGGYVIPVSPLQGLAKMLQSYGAAQGMKGADEKQRTLAAQAQADALKWMGDRPQGQDLNPVKMDDEGNAMPPTILAPTRENQEAWALKGMGNPISNSVASSYLATLLKGPESAFSKVDPKDYTTDSIARFAQTNNYADLVPVRKKEVVSLGGTSQVVDPYAATTGATMPHTVGPEFNQLSANQRMQLEMEAARLGISVQQLMMDRARLGNQIIETQFNTGSSAGVPALNVPRIPQIPSAVPAAGGFTQPPQPMAPQGAPQAPQMPVSAPMRQATVSPQQPNGAKPLLPPSMQGIVTPKKQAELAAEQPQALQALSSMNTTFDNAARVLDRLIGDKPIPKGETRNLDVSRVTGPYAGRDWVPNLTSKSTNADADISAIKNMLGVQQLQAMREASKTGGAVGNVTEKEWPILQSQIASLDKTQDTETFVQKLKTVRETLERMRNNATTVYRKTYGAPGGSTGSWKDL